MKTKDKRITDVDRAYHRMAVLATAIGFDVHEADIGGRSRRDRVAHARMTGYWLMRTSIGTPYEIIGILFGRDHSGVMYGCGRISDMIELGTTTYSNNWAKEIKESRKRFAKFHKARVEVDVERKLKEVASVIEST